MEEKEIWKDIEGFEGLYQVSNLGRVKSVKRTVWNSVKGYYKTVPERILKVGDNNRGYLQVQLYREGKGKWYLVHRLVAVAFIGNPNNLLVINHKNEIKSDNRVSNLEWCSYSYNNSYNDKGKKIGEKLSKPVIGIDKVTGLIVEFGSAHEAERKLGIDNGSIIKCCKGKLNSAGNFYWMYKNNNDDAE